MYLFRLPTDPMAKRPNPTDSVRKPGGSVRQRKQVHFTNAQHASSHLTSQRVLEVLPWLYRGIDNDDFNRAFAGLELQAELFLNCSEDTRTQRVHSGRRLGHSSEIGCPGQCDVVKTREPRVIDNRPTKNSGKSIDQLNNASAASIDAAGGATDIHLAAWDHRNIGGVAGWGLRGDSGYTLPVRIF